MEKAKSSRENWFVTTDDGVLMPADEKGESIFFIYSGTVNIMDKRILLQYGQLSEGSYFGDISTFLDEPS